MEVLRAIHHRQSIGKVKPDPLPKDVIERLLDAAVQAPNHHKVRPWRFFVLQGNSLKRLGDIMAESLHQRKPDLPDEGLAAERAKALRAPVIIAIVVDKPTDPKVVEIENICASAAAAENILLAAEGLGLAAMWRTGPAATDLAVKSFLGLDADQFIIGFIYTGYPEFERPMPERPGFEDRTTWLE